jgi:uncharacterized membrane protein
MKLIEDFEKKAFFWLIAGFVSTLAWISVLLLIEIIMQITNKDIYSWVGLFPLLNFAGFELYFLWLITKGKIKQMKGKWKKYIGVQNEAT